MGAALARGAQRHVMACVKHYACNSMENARFSVDVEVDERALHEVYLPHFRRRRRGRRGQRDERLQLGQRRVVRAEPRAAHRHPARRVGLRGLRRLGLHLRLARRRPPRCGPGSTSRCRSRSSACATCRPRWRPTPSLWADVDRSARRILATQLRFAASIEAAARADVVFSAAHLALAREAATKAIVLLRNEPVDGARCCRSTRGAVRSRGRRWATRRRAQHRRPRVLGRPAATRGHAARGARARRCPASRSCTMGRRDSSGGRGGGRRRRRRRRLHGGGRGRVRRRDRSPPRAPCCPRPSAPEDEGVLGRHDRRRRSRPSAATATV